MMEVEYEDQTATLKNDYLISVVYSYNLRLICKNFGVMVKQFKHGMIKFKQLMEAQIPGIGQ